MFVFQIKLWKFDAFKIVSFQVTATRFKPTTTYFAQPLRPVRLNGWVFVYELCGCGLESRCCLLNFRHGTCFVQGVPCNSGNYRMYIHSETRTWHDNNIQLFLFIEYICMEKHLIMLKYSAITTCNKQYAENVIFSIPLMTLLDKVRNDQYRY